jgi:hypothetical protein
MFLRKLYTLYRLWLIRLLRKSRIVRNWELWTCMGDVHWGRGRGHWPHNLEERARPGQRPAGD